jgi:signal transduction histidine kinase
MLALIGGKLGWAAAEFWSVDQVGHVLRRVTRWNGRDDAMPSGSPDPLAYGQGLPGLAWQTSETVWAPDVIDAGAEPVHLALAVPIPSGSTVLGVLVCYNDITESSDDIHSAVLTGIAAHIGEFLERRRAEQLSAELERTRDEYIALVGHELRTPLTSVQANTELMLLEPGLPADERADMLAAIQRNVARLHAIIGKLLDVAGIRSGHVPVEPRPMDLAVIVHAAADDARAHLRDGLKVSVNAPARAPIHGDPSRLRQVVNELLRNAVTWADNGTTVGINVHADHRTAVLTVSNTGSRIPADERDRLFDLFFRTNAALHHGLPGTGVGLTLARAIVEQHGGMVTISEPDEAATTFTVRLPADRQQRRDR